MRDNPYSSGSYRQRADDRDSLRCRVAQPRRRDPPGRRASPPSSPGGYFFLPTGVLATVTPTGSDTMTTPVSVVTEARRLCGPSATAVVSHFTVVDPSVSIGPSGCPSRWNCRLATALSLVMAALTSTEPFTVAPA